MALKSQVKLFAPGSFRRIVPPVERGRNQSLRTQRAVGRGENLVARRSTKRKFHEIVSDGPTLVETLALEELTNCAMRSVEGNPSGSGKDQHASQRTLDSARRQVPRR